MIFVFTGTFCCCFGDGSTYTSQAGLESLLSYFSLLSDVITGVNHHAWFKGVIFLNREWNKYIIQEINFIQKTYWVRQLLENLIQVCIFWSILHKLFCIKLFKSLTVIGFHCMRNFHRTLKLSVTTESILYFPHSQIFIQCAFLHMCHQETLPIFSNQGFL
jgi:hypothetical protein